MTSKKHLAAAQQHEYALSNEPIAQVTPDAVVQQLETLCIDSQESPLGSSSDIIGGMTNAIRRHLWLLWTVHLSFNAYRRGDGGGVTSVQPGERHDV
jgi:hypothetical protein